VAWIRASKLISTLILLGTLAGTFSNLFAREKDYVVYGVKNSLPMGEPGEMPQKDFYINVGKQDGVTKGTLLKVFRKVSTSNELQRIQYDLNVPVAKIIVIHAEARVSIARLVEFIDPIERAVVDVPNIIIGDRVELTPDEAFSNLESKSSYRGVASVE